MLFHRANDIVKILGLATSPERIEIIKMLTSIEKQSDEGSKYSGMYSDRIADIMNTAKTSEQIDLLKSLILYILHKSYF